MSQPEAPVAALTKSKEHERLIMKGADTMRKAIMTAKQPCETRIFSKRIGSTTYRVRVHFSRVSLETINDKIMRLVKSEVENERAVRP